MDAFLLAEVIPNLPNWFTHMFQDNHRLCLPYTLSVKDVDDILNATSVNEVLFHIDILDTLPITKQVSTGLDILNSVHDFIFHNAPAEAVISFGNRPIWLYFDGDQRFSVLVAASEIIRIAFPNHREIMKWYFVEQTDDISLDDNLKIKIFDSITTSY